MLLLIVGLALLAFVLVKAWNYRCMPLPDIPTIPYHWYLGHLQEAVKNTDHYHHWVLNVAKRFEGKSFQLLLPGPKTTVFVQDPACIEWILKKNFTNYHKSKADFYDVFWELFGDGIFNVSGESWKRQRKIASHMFSLKVLRDDIARMTQEHVQMTLDVLVSKKGEVIDLQNKFNQFTLDTICEVAFGEKVSTVREETSFSNAFDQSQAVIFKRFFDPLWRIKRVLSLGAEGDMKKYARVISDWCDDIIARRKQVKSEVLRKYPDLLSRFITEAEERKEPLTDKQLKDLVLNFVIAGRDTTACLLTWSVYALCKHPSEAKRLVEDVDRHMAAGAIIPSYDDVSRMEYVDAFLHETLRLYPSVPIEGQWTINPDVLPDGTKVPANVTVSFNPYYFGKIKSIYGEDAEEFHAERWLKPESQRPDQYMFPMFNAGMRLCLGKPVALLEAKIMLAALLRRFHVKLSPEDQTDAYAMYIVLPKKGGLTVTLTDRKL